MRGGGIRRGEPGVGTVPGLYGGLRGRVDGRVDGGVRAGGGQRTAGSRDWTTAHTGSLLAASLHHVHHHLLLLRLLLQLCGRG